MAYQCSLMFFECESRFLLCLVADMDSGAGPSLFPLHRCKTIHLVCFKFDFQFRYRVCCGFKHAILKDVQDCLLSWILLANQGIVVL